jgi:hypothetical protein
MTARDYPNVGPFGEKLGVKFERAMNYECIESKRDRGWAVEAINHEGEGEISRVLFMGRGAEALALEYAEFKNSPC